MRRNIQQCFVEIPPSDLPARYRSFKEFRKAKTPLHESSHSTATVSETEDETRSSSPIELDDFDEKRIDSPTISEMNGTKGNMSQTL
jgi:hypothetical protein